MPPAPASIQCTLLESPHVGKGTHKRHNRDEVNGAICDGLADIDAGQFQSADEAIAEIREEFGMKRVAPVLEPVPRETCDLQLEVLTRSQAPVAVD